MSKLNSIAVIGMGCRFPGAKNIDQFWENLKNGIESVTVFSDKELLKSGVPPMELNHSDYVKKGFVIEDEDKFDASFFGYSPKEASIIDPQQRLFLELSWEVLENGGYALDRENSSIGVFAGSKISTYLTTVLGTNMSSGSISDLQHLIANDKDYLTSRVSFKLNLKGPSITVQSACSTSLVAIHLACDSLLNGACDMAIAGGASIIIPHKKGYLFQKGLMLSPEGRCRVFDAKANGMVPGNGVGVVLLKRLEEAVADHDNIYAVIAGSAVNNDGADKVGYTAPSVEGQIKVIREAQTVAGIETDTISYIETHGTGTVLGDPIEVEAINEVFKTRNNGEKFCAIGSVKTNIGHLDASAGIAGFIKTVLCLKHGYLVPSLNYERPNPKIDFQNSPFYVNTRFLPWPVNGHPRRAGVSSFGFGGTNAHVILEEAPARPIKQSSDFPLHLFTLSAKTQSALTQQIYNYRRFIENDPKVLIEEICFTANTGRFHFRYRFAAVAASSDDLHLQLIAAVQKKTLPTLFQGAIGDQAGPKVTFDVTRQSFNHDQLTGIASDSHVLQALYRLPVMGTDKDESQLLLSALGKLYVHGADIDWQSFYQDSRFYRIPLPTYPFEKQRHWISSITDKKLGEHILISQISPQSLPDVPSGFTQPVSPNNPLAGRRLLSPVPVFEFKLDLEVLDLIKNHRIFDEIVLPGAAFFEMAVNVGEQMFSTETCLKDITLHHPLILPDDNTQETIQVVLESDGSEEEQPFKIFSLNRSEDDPVWELHASGIIQAVQTGSKDDLLDRTTFSGIQEKFCKTSNLVQVVNSSEDVFKIENIWRDQQEAFVSIQINPAGTEDCRHYKIHPLILNPIMESLIQAFIVKAGNSEEKEMMYIPTKVKHIRCNGGLTDRLWCHLSVHGEDVETSDGFSFDCLVLDQSGSCVAEFIGVYVNRIDPMSFQWKKSDQENLFYQIDWQAQPLQPDDDPYSPGKWVIFSDQNGVGQHITDLLESQDEFCIQIYADTGAVQPAKNTYVIDPENPDDYDRIFQNLPKDMSQFGMIHLWGMDATTDNYTNCGSLLHITKAMVNTGKVPERLCIVTQGVYKIKGHKVPVCVAQAPISGLAKVLAKEHPELNCLSIDTDALDADSALLQIIDEIQHANSDRETAFRDGVRYVPRLISCFPGIKKEPPCINNQGTYLITGAFGGLGMALAQWIIRGGGQHLLLAGRNNPNDDALKQIKEIEELGGSVHTLIADVSDFKTFSSGFNAVREGMPPLKGVFHLAGILKGDMILQQSYKDFAEIMAPKAAGAWNLHQLTQDIPLDFFVLFSTSSTLWGIQGTSAYTAANIFLDSLAHYRAFQGLPALSINWGAWARIGAAAKLHLEDRLSGQGFNSISPEACFGCLEVLLQCDMNQAGVMAMDWGKFLGRFPKNGRPPLFSSLKNVYSSVGRPKNKAVSSGGKIISSSGVLQKLPAHEQQDLMRTYLRKEISRILRIREDKISDDQNLIELGMDSLIFIELSQTLGEDLQLKIVPHKIFENPTIAAMARQFISDMVLNKTVSVLDSKLIQNITITHDVDNRYAPFDLTDIQQAYWIGRVNTLELGDIACHVYIEIDAIHLDYARYNQAWQTMIHRHEMLRAVILPEGSQKILETVPDYKINIADLTGKSLEQAEAALASTRDFMSHQVLDPEIWPIFDIKISRIDNETSRIHLSLDMLVVDALSVSQLMKELALLYQDEGVSLSPLEFSFRDYVLAEKQFEESDLFQQSKAYWMSRLIDIPPGPELPLIKKPGDVTVPHFKRRTLRLDPDTWKQLKTKAANAGLTPSGLLLSCYSEILSTWSKSPRFTINMTIFNRLPVHPQVNDILGDFTSLIMLVVDGGGQNSFIERAQKIQTQFWRDVEHRHFSGVRVLRELSRIQSGNVSMPVVFTSNLVYGDLDEIRMDSPAIGEVVYTVTQTPQVWLDHQITEQGNTLVLDWDAVEELFPEGMLDDMFNAYHYLLSRLAASDDWHVNWDLMPADQVLQRKHINETAKPISSETLNSLFIKQAEQQPDQTAVITSSVDISYKDLHHQSMVIASQLVDHGAISNTLIAVVMQKGWEQVVAVLGILNAGAAYLPIDPAVPKDRLWHLLEDGDVRFVLTQSWLGQNLEWPKGIKVFFVDTQDYTQHDAVSLKIKQSADDLAYVIHTSGSTGLPKGVMIDHKGAVNTILDINTRFKVGPTDTLLAISALNFDLSVYDIFGILAAGGTIVLPDPEGIKDPGHWLMLMKQKGVTIWNSVPQLMRMMTDYMEADLDTAPEFIRLVLLSGDWMPLNLPDKIRFVFNNAETISLGGATEASIWSILYPINAVDPQWKSIPYGRPMTNQQFYVLNENMDDCPDWVPGQLYIGGVGLAKGYWGDREKTEAGFIRHPEIGIPLYRTGDLGRFLPNGNIEFIGREDQQVKINGYRVELGEIEISAKHLPEIKDTVVTVNDDNHIILFFIAKEHLSLSLDELQNRLKHLLKQKLPEYMIPDKYIKLDVFPLTSNGKINRNALPKIKKFPDHEKRDSELEKGTTLIQRELLDLWYQIFKNQDISIHDSFFDIGGDSIKAIQFINEVRQMGEPNFSIQKLYKFPTIFQLSSQLTENKKNIEWSPLVPVQTKGRNTPFFCVHPADGNIIKFNAISAFLGENFPFYSLQSKGLDPQTQPESDIIDIASEYIQAIKTVQAAGPYIIGGYCMGGLIALEMANQLIQCGESVNELILISADILPEELCQDKAKMSGIFLNEFGIPYDIENRPFFLEMRNKSYDEIYEAIFTLAKEYQAIPNEMQFSQFRRIMNLIKTNLEAMCQYKLTPYDYKITYVKPKDPLPGLETIPDFISEFKKINKASDCQIEYVAGNHITCMDKDNIKEIAEVIRKKITSLHILG